jgi:plasmid stabilization system protein ParE
MSRALPVSVSQLAAEQIRAAAAWWRANRTKAPNAIREDFERASSLIAAQPDIGARARNANLPNVRRVHLARVRYDLYYRVVEPRQRIEILAFWHASRGGGPPI